MIEKDSPTVGTHSSSRPVEAESSRLSTTDSPAVALILKGGGVKGLALAGALEVLERHFSFSAFYGTSAGAIAAVLLGAGFSPSELRHELYKKDFREFLDASRLKRLTNLLTKGGLHSGDPLQLWIRDRVAAKIDRVSEVHLSDLGPARVVIYACNDREGITAFDSDGSHRDEFVDVAVRCSMAIPYFFVPVKYHDVEFVDGGLLANFPLTEFLKDNEPNFVGLYLSTPRSPASRGRWRFVRILQILLGRDERATVDRHRHRIVVIDPDPITTTQFDLTNEEKDFLLAAGRAAALEFLATHTDAAIKPNETLEAVKTAERLRAKAREIGRSRTRKRLLKTLGTAAVILLAIAVLLPNWTPAPPCGTYLSASPSEHSAATQKCEASGYRMESLSVFGSGADQRFSAIWNPGYGARSQSFVDLSIGEFAARIESLKHEGLRPTVVGASGPSTAAEADGNQAACRS